MEVQLLTLSGCRLKVVIQSGKGRVDRVGKHINALKVKIEYDKGVV